MMTKEKVNAYLLKMAQEKLTNPEKEIPSVNINNFEVSVTFDKMNNEVYFQVKGESTYFCVAGTAENQDNYQRISNLFEKGIPKKEQEIMKEISALEENLEQAKSVLKYLLHRKKNWKKRYRNFRNLKKNYPDFQCRKMLYLTLKKNRLLKQQRKNQNVKKFIMLIITIISQQKMMIIQDQLNVNF
ncbi:MAG: hypothetical protein K2I00_10155 [Ruminococcus sp.]|nr:hypothetical protein [Ruminococcus sp.]